MHDKMARQLRRFVRRLSWFSMVRQGLVWWFQQLGDLLPKGWRPFGLSATDAVVILPGSPLDDCTEVSVGLRRNGRETTFGRFRLDDDVLAGLPPIAGRPVILRLAEDQVLAKTLLLPLAAEGRLDQVLTFEMEQETPFSPEEVFWSHRIARRDRWGGRLWVRLLVIPRVSLARLLEILEKKGLRPARAEIAAGPDQHASLPLDVEERGFRDAPRWALRRAAAASCVFLAIAAAAIPFVRQFIALASIEREIARDRVAAAKAQALRQEMDRLSGRLELVEVARDTGGRPLATLAALTRQLPADTYLTDFTQQLRKVTLTGQSAAASRLIAILAAGGRLHNPAFSAPVTHIAGEQSEAFTITAEVMP